MDEGNLTLIELRNDDVSLRELQGVLEAAPTYHIRVNGTPAAPDEARRLFSTHPPGKTEIDKVVLGIYRHGKIVGCVDIVRGYPNLNTCFIGLLLIREDLQRRGNGIASYHAVEKLIRKWAVYSVIRLATVGTNNEVEGFWKRVGFRVTGERKPYQQGELISECILFEKNLR